jgi:hypothetical protein
MGLLERGGGLATILEFDNTVLKKPIHERLFPSKTCFLTL